MRRNAILTAIVGSAIGVYASDLAAVYVAIAASAIMYVLHGTEVKINRVLDQHGIVVTGAEIAE
jgi:hypothetical protein